MLIPKWLEIRYKILWEEFKDSPFSFDQASNILKEKNKESEDQVNVILAELRKKDLITAEFDPNDARKRIYRMKGKDANNTQIPSGTNSPLTRGDLEGLLKKAADLIRTRVDYTFILSLLFYKRISDKWEMDFENALREAREDGLSEKEAEEEARNPMYHDFDIPEKYLWEKMRQDAAHLPETFSKAMKALADKNPELKDVFENIDFVQFTANRENAEILRQLVELFSARPLQHVSPDILGDAYEWILKYFAPQKAKEGEVYTAREVIKLIVEILDPKPGEYVYDPACGSGGMLIISYQHVLNEKGKSEADKLFLNGQEANHKTLALAKMNLYIHDIKNAKLALGDTLLYPKFKEGEKLQKFDVVIANPPWNQDGYDEEVIKKGEFYSDRFRYGFTPRQSADWVWVQHMLASAKDDTGRVGVVIDNGCLFRGGKEKTIRTLVARENLIEAVILLPEKLFYNTGAPGAIFIFNKNKPADRKDKVLFINASREFGQHPDIRKLNQIGEANITNIAKAYREFEEREGFSKAISLSALEANDFNLNVTLYVFPEEETEEIDVNKEWQELRALDKEIKTIDEKIEGYLKELEENN